MKSSGLFRTLLSAVVLIPGLTGCLGMPDGVRPVENFDVNRYLGTWYEIARLDHRFERGLNNVSAEYSLRDDGGVRVINRGFSTKDNKWEEANGKAYFVESEETGYLKVSFFGPFYGSYVVFDLDQDDYQYSFVSGPDTSYLWLLSRTRQVPDKVLQRFMDSAMFLGFDTRGLILVEQNTGAD
jgi:apolipoprotein D and lipocalin family protein